ncbi:hypothetical protein ACXO2Y_07915 [Lactobacillus delbrueckii subsp. bulgaricus]
MANDEITTALWASVSRGRPLLLKHGGEIWSKVSDDEDDSGND